MLTRPGPLLVDVRGAAALLGVSRSTVYGLIGAGHLHGVKLGRSRRFAIEELEALIERLSEPDQAASPYR